MKPKTKDEQATTKLEHPAFVDPNQAPPDPVPQHPVPPHPHPDVPEWVDGVMTRAKRDAEAVLKRAPIPGYHRTVLIWKGHSRMHGGSIRDMEALERMIGAKNPPVIPYNTVAPWGDSEWVIATQAWNDDSRPVNWPASFFTGMAIRGDAVLLARESMNALADDPRRDRDQT